MVIAGAQSIIDGLILSRFAGLNAMASVNVVMPFVQIINAITFVVCTGSISKIGRLLGAGKIERAQSVFRTAALFNTIIAVIILIIGVSCPTQIARLLGASDTLVGDSAVYLRFLCCFTPIMINMFLFGFTNRIIGKPLVYLFATLTSVVVNIALDYLFIAVLQMGAKGAAVATGIAYSSAFIICAIAALKKSTVINLFVGKINFKEMPKVCANGASEAVVSLSSALIIYLFNRTLYGISGDRGIAAFAIINYFATFAILVMFGIADGTGSIFSYNYGSKNFQRVKKTLLISLIANLLIGITVFLILYLQSEKIITFFVTDKANDQSVIDMAVNGAKLFSIGFIFAGLNIVISGMFTAIGKALNSIIIAASRGIIWVIIGILTLPLAFGIDGIWLTTPFAEVVTLITCAIILILFYRKFKKENTADRLQN